MISISYAKKTDDGYILNLYADTAADITNFDGTKPLGMYGVPQTGSVITLVEGDTKANYYLNSSGQLVEIQVGGDTPTPAEFTLFSVGQTITGIDFGDAVNGETDGSIEEFIAKVDVEHDENSSVVVANTISGDSIVRNKIDNILFLGVLYNSGEDFVPVYSSDAYEAEGISLSKGFQNLTDGKYAFASSITIDYILDEEGWNGVLFGAVE